MDFFTDLLQNTFLQNALIAGLLASVACGIIGSFVVVKRITYIAGGIAHSVFAGLGAAVYLREVHNWSGMQPLFGAIVAALLSALIIGIVSLRAKERADTVIGALWAIGFAGGIFFQQLTPGYTSDLMSYLFGNILMVAARDLWLIVVLDAIVVIFSLLFYNQFLAVVFDEEFAEVRGVRTSFFYLFLLCLAALTVVLLVTVVGVVMVIALLTLPAAIASSFSRTLWQMMLLAIGLTMIFTTSGLAISYAPDWPPGASIILLTGGVYLIITFISQILRHYQARRQAKLQAKSEDASIS